MVYNAFIHCEWYCNFSGAKINDQLPYAYTGGRGGQCYKLTKTENSYLKKEGSRNKISHTIYIHTEIL